MKHNVVAPSVGESITEVRILKWNKKDGDAVRPGDVLLEIETDKATVEVAAESVGALKVIKGDGELVPVGEVLGFVDDAAKGNEAAKSGASPAARPAVPTPAAATYGGAASGTAQSGAALVAPGAPTAPANTWGSVPPPPASFGPVPPSSPASMAMDSMGPAARAHYMNSPTPPAGAVYAGGQVALTPPRPAAPGAPAPSASQTTDRPGDRRVPMTRLRARIAERLVQAQHTAAILTTFNEVDLTRVMEIRNKHKESFKAKNGVALSFMSFFTRAAVMALKQLPGVNASIDGGDVVYHDYYDVGIAVGTERGLVVPVLRNVEHMSFLQIEKGIVELAEKARSGKLSIPEMTGGTFTISNGGTYGSLLSTPILNPPQSGILGMHKIQERPVAVNGKVEVRPMMYLALSYDHRLIDGKEAVTFLVTMRDLLESPEKLGLDFA